MTAAATAIAMVFDKTGEQRPSHRTVFKTCLRTYLLCEASPSRTFDRRSEEFAADFILVSLNNLPPSMVKIFLTYIVGDRRPSTRGVVASIHNVEDRLGRLFCELKPYPLYPVLDYFTRCR